MMPLHVADMTAMFYLLKTRIHQTANRTSLKNMVHKLTIMFYLRFHI